MKRFSPQTPFPSYKFIPGVNPHPLKLGGHMEGIGEPVAFPIDRSQPEKNESLRLALDLFNHGYFWESHVYFEALWNAHERKGSTAEFLKGMIKLGAAGVKLNLSQVDAYKGHLERAFELFALVQKEVGQFYLGFDLLELNQKIKASHVSDGLFIVYPEWE